MGHAGHHHGTSGQSLPGRGLLPHHPLPHRLPLQAAQGRIHHPHLPPQHQLQRVNLPRHSKIPVVASSHHQQGQLLMEIQHGVCFIT